MGSAPSSLELLSPTHSIVTDVKIVESKQEFKNDSRPLPIDDVAILEGLTLSFIRKALDEGITLPGFRSLEKGMKELRKFDPRAFYSLPVIYDFEDIAEHLHIYDFLNETISTRDLQTETPVGYALQINYDLECDMFNLSIYLFYCKDTRVATKITKYVTLRHEELKRDQGKIDRLAAVIPNMATGQNIGLERLARNKNILKKKKEATLEKFIIEHLIQGNDAIALVLGTNFIPDL